jgi:non-ribosomal peptide synthetase component E (peptide arylation enzyme)
VSQFGDRTAVVSRAQKQRITYEELNAKSNALARGLRELGVQKGERIAVSLGNNIEFAVVCIPALGRDQYMLIHLRYGLDNICII